MNATQIKTMLKNIQKDFCEMGRPHHANDNDVIDLLIKMYYNTVEFDWEELQWLYTNYMKTGVLDFPKAKVMGIKRILYARAHQ